jgi:hypothetical protein
MKTLIKLSIIATCFGCLLASCGKAGKDIDKKVIHIPQGIYSDNILGQWKLMYVNTTVAGSSEEVIRTTDYSSANIIFDFFNSDKMNINKNGYLPQGEYFYNYHKYPSVDNDMLPGHNFVASPYEIDSDDYFIHLVSACQYFCYKVEDSNEIVLWDTNNADGFGEVVLLIKIL